MTPLFTEDTREGADPRCMLEAGGAAALSTAQLLAIVMRGGTADYSAAALAGQIIEHAGGVRGLADLSLTELRRVSGVGRARAAAVVAAVELGRRALAGACPGERLSSSAEVYGTFWPSMVGERVETFCCALVDAKLRLIKKEVVSRGTLTASIVHPREAFRPAVKNAASGVIFAHNHPSGDPLPSDEDRRITARLEQVGHILGIPLLDHVVIGAEGSYYSFADDGALEPQASGYRGMVLR